MLQNFLGQRFRFTLAAAIASCLLLVLAFWFQAGGNSPVAETRSSPSARLSHLPSTILWAWERSEKLDYIDEQKVGVAFLAKTIYLRGDRSINRPRLWTKQTPYWFKD